MTRTQWVGWLLVLAGWCWAMVIGNGFELQRQAVVVPVLLAGALLCCMSKGARAPAGWVAGVVLGCAAVFVVRAFTSPVRDLGRLDLVLVSAAVLSIWAGSVALRSRGGRGVFLVVVVLLLLANLGVGLYQLREDLRFSVLRGDRGDAIGVSGLYFHRNYLAGFLELALPCVGAWGLVTKRLAARLGGGLLLCAGLALVVATKSRAGIAVCGVSVLAVVLFWLVGAWRGLSKGWRVGALTTLLAAAAVLAIGTTVAFKTVQMERKGEEIGSGDMRNRLALSGIGFDVWLQEPIWGNGSRAYSYESVRHFSNSQSWRRLGNPEMAHNEYVQVLSDYGVVGLLAVLMVVLILGWSAWRTLRRGDGEGVWVGAALLASLLASGLHAVVDFNYHILPNVMFAAMLGGGCLGLMERRVRIWQPWVVVAGAFGLTVAVVTFGQTRTTLEWLRLERMEGAEYSGAARALAARAPEFRLLREIARETTLRRIEERRALEGAALAARCLEEWQAVHARHPRDPETLGNLARSLDWAGRFEEAEPYHRRTLEAVGERETVYGAMGLYAEHLRLWGKALWQARDPEGARYFLEESRGWVLASEKAGYLGVTRGTHQQIRGELDSLLRFFDDAGVVARRDDRILASGSHADTLRRR